MHILRNKFQDSCQNNLTDSLFFGGVFLVFPTKHTLSSKNKCAPQWFLFFTSLNKKTIKSIIIIIIIRPVHPDNSRKQHVFNHIWSYENNESHQFMNFRLIFRQFHLKITQFPPKKTNHHIIWVVCDPLYSPPNQASESGKCPPGLYLSRHHWVLLFVAARVATARAPAGYFFVKAQRYKEIFRFVVFVVTSSSLFS